MEYLWSSLPVFLLKGNRPRHHSNWPKSVKLRESANIGCQKLMCLGSFPAERRCYFQSRMVDGNCYLPGVVIEHSCWAPHRSLKWQKQTNQSKSVKWRKVQTLKTAGSYAPDIFLPIWDVFHRVQGLILIVSLACGHWKFLLGSMSLTSRAKMEKIVNSIKKRQTAIIKHCPPWC